MTPTPRMKTNIKKDRTGLFALVTIEHEGSTVVTTTMDPDVKPTDVKVENLKRGHVHLPLIREES